MNEDQKDVRPAMNRIPVITESPIASRQCYGCGREDVDVFKLAIRVSDTQQQSITWCNRCAGEVLNFLDSMVIRVK